MRPGSGDNKFDEVVYPLSTNEKMVKMIGGQTVRCITTKCFLESLVGRMKLFYVRNRPATRKWRERERDSERDSDR